MPQKHAAIDDCCVADGNDGYGGDGEKLCHRTNAIPGGPWVLAISDDGHPRFFCPYFIVKLDKGREKLRTQIFSFASESRFIVE